MIQAARRIVEKLRRHGHEAYFAGGWVRDSLLGRKSKDVDIATSAVPDEVIRIFPHTYDIGTRFGVVHVRMYGRTYEVTTFRSDADYMDGRHPSSVTFSGPQQDALRRDFTINGLFYDPGKGRILDYVHGRSDLKSRIIRTIGDPNKRFTEDKLRLLRAIRFAATLGFRIESKTWIALNTLAPEILQVSWERIRDELAAILTGPAPGTGFFKIFQSGILYHLLPEFETIPHKRSVTSSSQDLITYTQTALDLLYRPSLTLAFGALLHGLDLFPTYPDEKSTVMKQKTSSTGKTIQRICRRLRISGEETKQITDLVRTLPTLSKVEEMPVSVLKRLLRKPHFKEHLQLYRIHARSLGIPPTGYEFCRKKLKEYVQDIYAKQLLNGEDLIFLGYQPGPGFKNILHSIEDLQLEGKIVTRKEAISYVRKNYPLARPFSHKD